MSDPIWIVLIVMAVLLAGALVPRLHIVLLIVVALPLILLSLLLAAIDAAVSGGKRP